MKTTNQSVELFGVYNWDNIKYHIAAAGSVCYNKPKESPEEISMFLHKLCRMKHLSVLEHCNVSFKIITSRSMLAQISRHRHMSFSVQSQRYCNYSKGTFGNEITFIEPENKSMFYYETWKEQMTLAENAYLALVNVGVPPEDAREVLPNSTATTIIMTGNLRAWREYIDLRTGPATQKAHRKLAELINLILSEHLPEIFVPV